MADHILTVMDTHSPGSMMCPDGRIRTNCACDPESAFADHGEWRRHVAQAIARQPGCGHLTPDEVATLLREARDAGRAEVVATVEAYACNCRAKSTDHKPWCNVQPLRQWLSDRALSTLGGEG